MARTESIGIPLAEAAERLSEKYRLFSRDGVISQRETYELGLEIRGVHRVNQMVSRSLGFVGLALVGDGVDGSWFARRAKEHTSDMTWLGDDEDAA